LLREGIWGGHRYKPVVALGILKLASATNSQGRGAGRPTRAQIAEIREKIFSAAMIEFSERGFHGASIANIASRAGVSRMTVYKHFESKEQLLEKLSDHSSDRLRGKLAEAIEDGQPCWSVLMNVGRCFYQDGMFFDSRAIARIMVMEADRLPEIVRRGLQLRRKALEPLTSYLQRLAFEGVVAIDSAERSAQHLLHLTTSSVDFLFSQEEMTEAEREQYLAAAVKTFLYGVHLGRTPAGEER
jgi:AcrR family transcriptional regulator